MAAANLLRAQRASSSVAVNQLCASARNARRRGAILLPTTGATGIGAGVGVTKFIISLDPIGYELTARLHAALLR